MIISDVSWSESQWLDLLNSDWHDHLGTGAREDRLRNQLWLKHFLRRWNYDVRGIPKEMLIETLSDLRKVMRRVAKGYAVRTKIGDQDWNQINAYLRRAPYIRQLRVNRSRPMMENVPMAGDLETIMGDIAGSFAESVAHGDPHRIKICQNKDCQWFLYDRSKNKSRRFCEDTCRNLMKIRRFRKHLLKK